MAHPGGEELLHVEDATGQAVGAPAAVAAAPDAVIAAEPPASAAPVADGVPHVGRRAATGILTLVVLCWGFNWPVLKVGLQYIPPFSFAAIRFVLSCIAVTVLVAALRQLRPPDRRDVPIVLNAGLLQLAAVSVLIIVALQYVPAGRASILIYTTPLWVTPLAAVFLHERLTRLRMAGLVVGMAGVLVLFNPLGFDWSDPDVVLGNALLLLGAFGWAVTIVHVRGHTWHATPLQLLPWQLGLAAVVTVPLALVFESAQPADWTSPLPLVIAYTAFIATAFTNWGIITVNRALPATTTALLTLGVPVVGVLASSLVFSEPLDLTTAAGLSLIVAGLAAVALGQRQAAAPRLAPGATPSGR